MTPNTTILAFESGCEKQVELEMISMKQVIKSLINIITTFKIIFPGTLFIKKDYNSVVHC